MNSRAMAFASLRACPPICTVRRSSPSAQRVCEPCALALRRRLVSSRKPLALHRSRPRSSLSGTNPALPPDDDGSPEQSGVDQSDAASPFDPSSRNSSAPARANDVPGPEFERAQKQREQQLQESLAVLSQSLALLSSTLDQISSAVRVLSSALGTPGMQPTPQAEVRAGTSWSADPPEPWDSAAASDGQGAGVQDYGGFEGSTEEDVVPPHLVEQNRTKHKLAYKLQQAFVQSRIEGLGKPFQVAIGEFAEACMAAHAFGIGLKEIQLQLILQDGSLPGAFGIRNQRWSDDPILNEESRVRSLWIRLVYATLAQLDPTGTWDEDEDPIDLFVKQVIEMALENGYDLERIKLEQSFAGPLNNSGAAKTMRENQFLILLTLEKAKSERTRM